MVPQKTVRLAMRSSSKPHIPTHNSIRALLSNPTAYRVAGTMCLAMSIGVAAAQTPGNEPLDMAAAIRAAVQSHPSVRGAGEQVLQAGESVEAAKAGYKPQITGGVDVQNNSSRNSNYDSRHVFTAKLAGSQMLYDFGKVTGAVRMAESSVRASKAQVELAIDQVTVGTAQAWVDAHLQQSLLQITREQLAAVSAIKGRVTERYTKGATSQSDVEQANSRVDAVRAQLLGAEAEAQRASLALMHLTGRTAPVEIVGDIPVILYGAACQGSVEEPDTPAVRIAAARRDEALAGLFIARAQRMPTVSLDGSVGQALTRGSRLNGEEATTGQVGINLSMPLYQGGSAQARERGATYQLRAFEDGVRQAQLEMRQGFADAKAQVDGWSQRAPVLQARVESINATRGLYQQQYLHLGTRSLLDLLNAEQEYFGARNDQAQGEHSQYRLAVQCLYFNDRLRSSFGLEDAGAATSVGEQ